MLAETLEGRPIAFPADSAMSAKVRAVFDRVKTHGCGLGVARFAFIRQEASSGSGEVLYWEVTLIPESADAGERRLRGPFAQLPPGRYS